MERKASKEMLAWKENPDRKALLVRGARQTGKTYLIRQFAEENYCSYIYIDLEENGSARRIFETDNLTADNIINRLLFEFSDIEMVPGKSAIVLDEIQECLPAYSALKTLVNDGRYDIMASGSLLGVKIDYLQKRSPMGYVDIIEMKSMDFEEFLWAMDINPEYTEKVRKCMNERRPIDDFVCNRFSELFRMYMVVGGMPAAVLTYSQTRNYGTTRKVLNNILSVLEEDAERYSKGKDRLKINSVLHSIPEQLSEKNKKFQYIRIEKTKGGERMYGSSVLWLEKAGLISICRNLREPVAPLRNRVRKDSFKIYMNDTGLLTSLMEDGVPGTLVNRDPFANSGAVAENVTACMLGRLGYDLFFYEKPDSTLEIDFVINMGGEVAAIEVKSGKDRRAKSLYTAFTKNKDVTRAIKLSEGNVFTDENGIENYPLFASIFLPRSDDYFSDIRV